MMSKQSAMIFAAGFGTRMKALTNDTPKPMVPVLGRPMIDHCLDLTADAGIKNTVVNTHYFSEQLEDHLSKFPNVCTICETPNILETGGGLKNALALLGSDPVVTLNCDAIWFGDNPILHLLQHWDPNFMDGLLVLQKTDSALGHKGVGDFDLTSKDRLIRRGEKPTANYIYAGLQIIKTDHLADIDQRKFSISLIWDIMLEKRTLYGLPYTGDWIDVGHPEGLELATQRAANV